jgi:regulator of replication initiation timing
MLDWLNGRPTNSTTEESQIADAPETPAPVFAYRALKGILFGSPDYEAEDEDKENIAPASPIQKVKESTQEQSRSRNVDSSPVRSKSTQSPKSRARDRHPVSPSPRKRQQLSPTKSILRTPGIPTPRRQNVNVTFKDVRPSVSPVAVTTKLLAAKNEARAVRANEEAVKMATITSTDAPPGIVKAADTAEILPVQVYDMSSVDTYLKSTEREMKKLVRYSQKMKEYARVSQQENKTLRKERDELRRELEELRKAKATTRVISDEHTVEKDSDTRTAATKRVAGSAGVRSVKESTSAAKRPDNVHTMKATRSCDRDTNGGCRRSDEAGARSGADLPDQKKAENTLMHDGGHVAEIVSKKRATTTAQLPPDRLAAAKERLRVKSEERRRALSAAVG